MPESVEGRLGRVERDAATLAERTNSLVQALDRLVPTVVPTSEAIVELRAGVREIRGDVITIVSDNKSLRKAVSDREDVRIQEAKDHRKERRADRILLWSLTGGIVAAAITAIGGIFAAGAGP